MTTQSMIQTMTSDEVAARAKVTVRTLRNWAKAGIGPAPVKLGPRVVRYRKDEVDAWLAGADEGRAS